jgi:phospholipid/cholesterol/gamma-HCH transport system permease protein
MADFVRGTGRSTLETVRGLGRVSLFAREMLYWTFASLPPRRVVFPLFYEVGVRSLPVVLVTGTFIGMVLAVQMFSHLHRLGAQNATGMIINLSMVKELGPVLAAVILAGRVGGAMAAELGTMRVTEQIDALACLGVDPVHYLVVPRFLACVLLIPLLTVLADAMGMFGGGLICLSVYGIEPHHYWLHGKAYLGLWDVFTSLAKATVFGAFIALISCHRGFHSRAGSEGVGRAATEAFVLSFIAILVIDFFLALLLNSLQERLFGVLTMQAG